MNHRGMPVTSRRMRAPAIFAMAMGITLTLAACSAAGPTPIVVHTTPTPSPTASPTATPTPTPTAAPTATPAVDSPTPTTPAAPTATPTAGPTGPAGGCSGSQANKDWWAAESKKLTAFTVYCGVMPGGWYFSTATDTYNKGGTMIASYKGPSGAVFTIKEGAFCTTGGSACSPHDTSLGSAKFGDLTGGLYTLGPGLGYAIYVSAGTAKGYTATGTGTSQATFVNLAAALLTVPKS